MARSTIYVVDGNDLKRMNASVPENEARMQELVERYPELIAADDGELLLVRREQPIGDGQDGDRWSLDHLFVTREAVPVLVELKRASDTRIKREVVGQLIDYAANASAHWTAGAMAESFARTVGDGSAEAILAAFIPDRNPEDFWAQAEANLKAGRMRLVFVADVIPRELAVIVEFLNAQMRAEVRAVELRWFSDGQGLTTLAPRVIGETEHSSAGKASRGQPPMEAAAWISERIAPHGPETLAGAERLCAIVEREGGTVFVPSTRGSLVASWPTSDSKLTYVIGLYPSGLAVLRLGYLKNRPGFADESARRRLYDQLVTIVGPLHRQHLAGEPGFPAALLNDERVAQAFAAFLQRTVAAAQAA